jgi:hypothetical protein
MKFTFTPTIEVVCKLNGVIDQNIIDDEPMLFSASPDFALNAGGPLTRNAIEHIARFIKSSRSGKHWVIDTRSHMLMPGMYPAIGGWHCDAVSRSSYTAQPDLSKMDDANHFVMTLSTHEDGVSNTEFICEELTFNNIDKDRVWGSISRQVGDLGKRVKIADGEMVRFTSSTLHRATAATRRGWRWFIRCSEYEFPPQNKIRKQVQVYTDIQGGW